MSLNAALFATVSSSVKIPATAVRTSVCATPSRRNSTCSRRVGAFLSTGTLRSVCIRIATSRSRSSRYFASNSSRFSAAASACARSFAASASASASLKLTSALSAAAEASVRFGCSFRKSDAEAERLSAARSSGAATRDAARPAVRASPAKPREFCEMTPTLRAFVSAAATSSSFGITTSV